MLALTSLTHTHNHAIRAPQTNKSLFFGYNLNVFDTVFFFSNFPDLLSTGRLHSHTHTHTPKQHAL